MNSPTDPKGAEVEPASWLFRPGGTTARLRTMFLMPLVAAVVAAVAVLILDTYFEKRRDMQGNVIRVRASASDLYHDSVRHNTRALRTVMDVLANDQALRDGLARRDRRALLARAAPVFEGIRREYDITHFYFTGADRVNLLRVHKPDRFGDVIDRATTLLAERGGAAVHGVELGPLGTFTLRLVSPWFDRRTRRLLGYVELGMEIDEALEAVRELTGFDLFILVSKKYVERTGWEEGMRALGREPDWDRFPGVVMSVQGAPSVPPELAHRLAGGRFEDAAPVLDVLLGRREHRALFLPLRDVAGRHVAQMVLLADVSEDAAQMRRTVLVGATSALAAACALVALFYWLVGQIGARLERDEQELRRLATRDGLTGLYNQRMFYSLLEGEVARARRYGTTVCLLMLDIDYFKRVNDQHGHLAGDAILRGLAALLKREARATDRVCRYGGEEIALILPHTDGDAALLVAERIRAAVETQAHDAGAGRQIPITVSIGVADCPASADSAQALVGAADRALYTAKQAGRNCVRAHVPPQRDTGE